MQSTQMQHPGSKHRDVGHPSATLVLRSLWVCGVPLRGAGHCWHAAGQGRPVWQACQCGPPQGLCRASRRCSSSAKAGPHTDVQWGCSRGADARGGSARVGAHAQHARGADCASAWQHVHVPPTRAPTAHRPCWALPAAHAEQPADCRHNMGRSTETRGHSLRWNCYMLLLVLCAERLCCCCV